MLVEYSQRLLPCNLSENILAFGNMCIQVCTSYVHLVAHRPHIWGIGRTEKIIENGFLVFRKEGQFVH